jgi:hypothetical protein
MTPITPKNTSLSSSDAHSKTRLTDPNQTCPHCGHAASLYPDPYLPNAALRCRECGRKTTDLSCFYVVDKTTGRWASPEFASLAETKQFAAIFGMTSYAGYGLRECTYLLNGARDEPARRKHREDVAGASRMLARLLELQPSYTGPDGLKALAVCLHLERFALPPFRDQSKTVEVG